MPAFRDRYVEAAQLVDCRRNEASTWSRSATSHSNHGAPPHAATPARAARARGQAADSRAALHADARRQRHDASATAVISAHRPATTTPSAPSTCTPRAAAAFDELLRTTKCTGWGRKATRQGATDSALSVIRSSRNGPPTCIALSARPRSAPAQFAHRGRDRPIGGAAHQPYGAGGAARRHPSASGPCRTAVLLPPSTRPHGRAGRGVATRTRSAVVGNAQNHELTVGAR